MLKLIVAAHLVAALIAVIRQWRSARLTLLVALLPFATMFAWGLTMYFLSVDWFPSTWFDSEFPRAEEVFVFVLPFASVAASSWLWLSAQRSVRERA
jgi:hypothetical protein